MGVGVGVGVGDGDGVGLVVGVGAGVGVGVGSGVGAGLVSADSIARSVSKLAYIADTLKSYAVPAVRPLTV